jgi:RNA polymerase sigma-70 factor (ECF subfamily)
LELYQRYGPALLRKCERMLGNRQDAEDVVQSLFIDLLRRGRTSAELPYLYRAATTRSLNVLRDGRRRRELLARHGRDVLAPVPGAPDGRVLSLDLLIKLTESLDERSAEILVYRYLDHMQQDEIARLMRLSRRTVGKRLGRIQGAVEALSQEAS